MHTFSLRSLLRPSLAVATLFLFGALLSSGTSQALWDNTFWTNVLDPTTVSGDLQVCSDGQGGTLVAMIDEGSAARFVFVNRLDRTGNKLWGSIGQPLPYEVTSDGLGGPLAITSGPGGGAFIAHREIYGGLPFVKVVQLAPDGTYIGAVVVAPMGTDSEDFSLAMVPSDNGGVIVVWNVNGTFPLQPLHAARITAAMTTDWISDSGLTADVTPNPEPWLARPDGQGGVLIAANHQVFGGSKENRVQRVSGTGQLMWGSNGSLVWPGTGDIVELVSGNVGDTFAMLTTGYGDAIVQRLDQAGGPLWAAGGLTVLDAATWAVPNEPVACTDQAGGFFVVAGTEDLLAQRVGPAGNKLWAAAGVPITSLEGGQYPASIASDGFGGMLVTYEDHYFSLVGDPFVHAVSARRIDAFANILWARDGFWWAQVDATPSWRLREPVIVADGAGGGHVVWSQFGDDWSANDVYAAGLGPDGATPATPTLAAMWPDGGRQYQTMNADVLGTYLDASYTYTLEQTGFTVPLTETTVSEATILAGDLSLGAAGNGAYDLVCRNGGMEVARLVDAFGIGADPGCATDVPLGLPDVDVQSFGSQRKAAFDPSGQAHYAWLAEDPGSGSWTVQVWTGDDLGGTSAPLWESIVPLRDLTFTIGPDGRSHAVFVSDDGGTQVLHYIRAGVHFSSEVHGGVGRPALEVDAGGRAMIVMESDVGGTLGLVWMEGSDGGLGPEDDLQAGANAQEPDLAVGPDGFVLTFVRDSWFPGLHEVCRQHHVSDAWQAPETIVTGVDVSSPSVAWDRADRLLFAWILDNAGGKPLLHTMVMDNGVPGPVRWRQGLGLIYRCSVSAADTRAFRLMTQESVSGLPMEVILRSGDGNVFYARRRINISNDIDFTVMAGEFGGTGLFAAWEDYELSGEPVSGYFCRTPVSAVALPPMADRGLAAAPNPFNPRTTFHFTMSAAAPAVLQVHDVRGRMVRTLHTGLLPAGPHDFTWDGTTADGSPAGSGVYLGRLLTPEGEAVVKVLMLK